MSVAQRSTPPAAEEVRRSWLLRHRGFVEFAIVGICFLIYFLIRGAVVDEPIVAFRHAEDVIAFEKALGIFVEPQWQAAIRNDGAQIWWWNFVYFWWHAPVIAGVAFWLYFKQRNVYYLIRNAFLISCIIGLIVYATYPVAPPRLMTPSGYAEYHVTPGIPPTYGFVDTMAEHSKLDYQAESLQPFVNPFAAVPSLHFGWAFLIGLGIALGVGARRWWGWAVATALTVLMFFAVVLTANHFIVDAIAGLIVCLIGLGGALLYRALPESWHRWLTLPPLREPVA